MIIIDKQTRGRFGNKVFHYNSLVQLSNILNQEHVCAKWDGSDLFTEIKTEENTIDTDVKEIPSFDLINLSESQLKKEYSSGNFKLHSLSLCGPFFRITKKDPRDFMKIELKIGFKEEFIIGIHIRGGDTRGADGMQCKEIHPPEYYINAIEFVKEQYKGKQILFCLCTDDPDPNYPSFQKTLDHLLNTKSEVYLDTNNSYQKDFSILANCDVLIAGSSTFVTAAGMLGKHKKIIHSKDFVEQFKEEDQKWYSSFGNGMFFHDMNHMKSDYYNVWKLL
tara:strand:- start:1575 stop:2408 length:834 start_codon:yes stop_codon:yes gene_type:complete